MQIHDENLPSGLWRLGRIKELIAGSDGNIRSAVVRVASRGRVSTVVNRPIQRLYPLEFTDQEMAEVSAPNTTQSQTDAKKKEQEPAKATAAAKMEERVPKTAPPKSAPSLARSAPVSKTTPTSNDMHYQGDIQRARDPRRQAFDRAQDRLQAWCKDLNSS